MRWQEDGFSNLPTWAVAVWIAEDDTTLRQARDVLRTGGIFALADHVTALIQDDSRSNKDLVGLSLVKWEEVAADIGTLWDYYKEGGR